MAPPSQLAIATSSINRLLKEETSYRTELNNQQSRLEKLLAGNGTNEDVENTEFQLRQEKKAIEETKAVFGPLRERIQMAVERVEGMVDSSDNAKELEAAKDALARAKAV